jgi:hypothetical protein
MDSNHRCLVVGQESLPLDHGIFSFGAATGIWSERFEQPPAPVSRLVYLSSDQAEAVGLEPTIRAKRTPVFGTGPSSGRMTSVKRANCPLQLRGLESNQRPPGSEPGVTTSSNCPAVMSHRESTKFGEKDSNLHRLLQRQEAYR